MRRLAFCALLAVICTLAIPGHVALAGGCPFPNPCLDAYEVSSQTALLPPGADTVSATVPLKGVYQWTVDMNAYPGSTVTNPTISLVSGYPASSFLGPTTKTQATLTSGPPLALNVYSTIPTPSFAPGFDAQHSTAPRYIPSGGADQTTTVAVTLRDPTYDPNQIRVVIFPWAIPGATLVSWQGPRTSTKVSSSTVGLGSGSSLGRKPTRRTRSP